LGKDGVSVKKDMEQSTKPKGEETKGEEHKGEDTEKHGLRAKLKGAIHKE
jgi:hypothetical protein